MPRSLKKPPFICESLYKKVMKALQSKSKKSKAPPIKTRSRGSVVIPNMVGLVIMVHNGLKFVPVLITEFMVGHKLGEFVPTRVFKGHPGSKATQ